LAVLVATIVFFMLGWLWYDALFGRTWMALSGHVETSVSSMTATFAGSFVLRCDHRRVA
jgi:hypothetical protein